MTTNVKRRILTSGFGAFLVVIATAGGCSMFRGRVAHNDAPTAAPQAAPATRPAIAQINIQEDDQRQPASVNIFGEFDGMERPAESAGANSNFQQHTHADEGGDFAPAIDPSGKWIVFSSNRHSDRANIYLQKTNGLAVTQLTADDADDAFPTFSPDGKHIAFSSTRAGDWDIYVMDTDGRGIVQITNGAGQDLHPSFSPDGSRLVYSSLASRSGQWELWIVNLATGERRMIGYGLFPTWSPSKELNRIAFQRARQRGSRWFSLWTLDLIDGEARKITEVAVSSNSAIVLPAWSPDGNRLCFSTIVEPAKMTGGRPTGQQDLWTINADGSNRQRLTDGNGENLSPCWAVDDRVYFISNRSGNESVWSVHVDSAIAQRGWNEQTPGGTDAVGSTDMGEVGH